MDKQAFYRSYCTAITMIKDRGYDVPEIFTDKKLEEKASSFQTFKHLTEKSNKAPFDFVTIYLYPTTQQLNSRDVLTIGSHFVHADVPATVIVICPSYNSTIMDIVNKISNHVRIQLFTFDQMFFPIVNSVHVPKHRKLDQAEKHAFLNNYKVEIRNGKHVEEQILKLFPILLLNDPISLYYDYKNFDVVEVNHYYRVVFDNKKPQGGPSKTTKSKIKHDKDMDDSK